jgi:hypothetical protein
MNDKLQKDLCTEYPKIFSITDPNISVARFGIECDDGWYDLIEAMCHEIQSDINYKLNNQIPITQVVATQIKEKFGGLNFYYEGGDDFTDGIVTLAENLSYKICETCGNKGETKGKHWLKTTCDACEK